MENWVNIYSINKAYLAEMAKEVLEENSIESVIINKQDSVYLFGEIELYVHPDNVIKAKHILKDFDH